MCAEEQHDHLPDGDGADQPSVPGGVEPGSDVTLKRKLKSARNKIYYRDKRLAQKPRQKVSVSKRKERLIEEMHSFLPAATAKFVETQLLLVDKKKKGRRWTEQDKTTALSLYHASRKAYRLLKKIFVLPSVSTLRKAVRAVNIYPGFNESILNALKHKIQCMPANSELCSLVFDEMSIKEKVAYNIERDEVEGLEDFGNCGRTKFVANHATVFLVRGLMTNWKQPVGYFLSSGPMESSLLHTLLIECIDKLSEAGLSVKCVVADQGSNNRKVFTKFCKVTELDPFFVHNGQKIHVLYDPPHLLKNIRNNLKKSGFSTDRGDISWQHIVDFYNFDKQSPIRLAPRLTEKHITLPPFSTLRVKYATQVMSHSVAVGISYIARLRGDDGSDACETADFLEKFDRLFNAFNSGSLNSHQKMGHAIKEDSGHVPWLLETLEWLETVRSSGSRALPCLSGWKMAIRTLLALWADLKDNHNVKFLLTDRLNQDCIENLFSQIRGNTGHVANPSAAEFRSFMRRAMVDHIIHHSEGSNCAEDTAHFLLTLNHISAGSTHNTDVGEAASAVEPVAQQDERVAEEDLRAMLLIATPEAPPKDTLQVQAEDNVLTYISGYVARKLVPKVCASCQRCITGPLTGAENQEFLVLKQFSGCASGLTVPSDEVVHAVKLMEGVFCKNFSQVVHVAKVRARMIALLMKGVHESDLVCPMGKCELKARVAKLFCNIRLHFALKVSSESFSKKSAKRNPKMMNLSHM